MGTKQKKEMKEQREREKQMPTGRIFISTFLPFPVVPSHFPRTRLVSDVSIVVYLLIWLPIGFGVAPPHQKRNTRPLILVRPRNLNFPPSLVEPQFSVYGSRISTAFISRVPTRWKHFQVRGVGCYLTEAHIRVRQLRSVADEDVLGKQPSLWWKPLFHCCCAALQKK